jgi:hypothetical protein
MLTRREAELLYARLILVLINHEMNVNKEKKEKQQDERRDK